MFQPCLPGGWDGDWQTFMYCHPQARPYKIQPLARISLMWNLTPYHRYSFHKATFFIGQLQMHTLFTHTHLWHTWHMITKNHWPQTLILYLPPFTWFCGPYRRPHVSVPSVWKHYPFPPFLVANDNVFSWRTPPLRPCITNNTLWHHIYTESKKMFNPYLVLLWSHLWYPKLPLDCQSSAVGHLVPL